LLIFELTDMRNPAHSPTCHVFNIRVEQRDARCRKPSPFAVFFHVFDILKNIKINKHPPNPFFCPLSPGLALSKGQVKNENLKIFKYTIALIIWEYLTWSHHLLLEPSSEGGKIEKIIIYALSDASLLLAIAGLIVYMIFVFRYLLRDGDQN
jgi:hypothetical protein